MHLAQCVLRIWHSVYCAFGTVCTVQLVQHILCIWYGVYCALCRILLFLTNKCTKSFFNIYLILVALLHVSIPTYIFQEVVHVLELHAN